MFNDVLTIITYIRRSHNQLKLSKQLQIFSKTRWNSAYDMICSFIEVYPELNDILTDKKQREILVQIDFNDLMAFTKYFKYFVDVRELLSAEKASTIYLVITLKQRLIDLSQQDAADSQAIKNVKNYIRKKLLDYWEINDVHFIAVVLNPKFKHLHICSNEKDKKKAYDLIIKEIEKRRGKSQNSYAIHYSIVCDVLFVPATNTAGEGLFSASGNAVTETRIRLAAQKVDKLIFIKKIFFFLKKFFDDNEATPLGVLASDTTASKSNKRSYEQSFKDDHDFEDTIKSDNDNNDMF
ncbi:unnamed protein product [Rotaria sp. Silwood2]|nr:unnamed protein product [Rotaria sp. Silwood2]CAF3163166.1 unnamed protein product [Rotaria sp. Silwood2]CAF3372048.1 unnamed protein product [Rotaria sp. Silwood2]CAF3397108.1 unnamed protein product [Rotaria sp. Silwood2]CAF4608789.1 unnamed protein product [Rotaria sp. Silwood2]